MTRFLACLLALTCAAECIAADPKEPQEVVPAIVYRDHLFVHGRNPLKRTEGSAITIRSLDNRDSTLVLTPYPIGCMSGFGSMFVRGRVLVTSGTMRSFNPMSNFWHRVFFGSPDQLCDGKWAFVEPTGEVIKPEGGQPSVWHRTHPNSLLEMSKPGESEIVHTAIAAEGERNLLAFDLIVTIPPKGNPAPGYHIAVTRVVPEERTAPVLFGTNDPKPEVKHVENVTTAFSEPFQAYLVEKDYYFLTKSGLVYRSQPAEKGKPRTMSPVWDKDKPRVRYFISDGNKQGAHYLLTYRAEKVGEKTIGWEYFQFAPDPKPQQLTSSDSLEDVPHIEAVRRLVQDCQRYKQLFGATKKP